MKRKFLLSCLTFAFTAAVTLFVGTSCASNQEKANQNNEIYSVYTTYVAYAEENGQTPLSYEEWLASIKGEKGETGANGVDGISPKLQINSTTNMWEISYDDGKTWTSLNVKATGENGSNGTNGINGVDGISPKLQINATTNMWEISYDDGKTWTSLNVKATGENGANGTNGINGVDGISPKLQINTTTNMWEVSYDDGKTWTSLNVKATGSNGTNGTNGTNGVDGVSPKLQINATTNMWEISYDNGKTWTSLNVKATGSNGANGTNGVNGLSAYELFKKYNPTYNKTESEWLEDLVAGKLHVINITIDGDGGNVADSNIITKSNSYISVDIPTKNGYDFVGWSLNGSIIDINTYVFFTDCTLKAIWKDAEKVTVTFNADSGIVSPVKTIIEFGKNYSLPTPSKEYQTFAGWYYLDTLIPQTGVWEYTHEEITLTAKWNKTNIYANLSVDTEYGAVDKTKVTLAIGDYYTLPIPSSLKDGESFQGWYNGNEKVTDSQGKSFEKCTWNSTVTLTAAYYTEISTIYEFMDLAGKDLVGKYIITQDLDFKGLGVNCINSLTGTFDGGGHTLKNFTLSTGASYNTYSGLFKTVNSNSTICNIVFENVNCSEQYASGLIGVAYAFNTTIDNITIKNSFHNNMKSIMIGTIVGVTEKDIAYNKIIVGEIFLNNIFIKNSGEKVNTYGIYNLKATGINTSQGYYDDYYPIVNINKFQIDGNNAQTQNSAGVLYTTEKSLSGFNITCTTVEKPTINIKHYVLNIDIDYGIAPETMYTRTITVSQSEIHSKTKIAWSMVTLLEDSIHTGITQSWGASESNRCIDTGSEIGSYNLGEISSSIILYPDANGVFTYYSASGTMATFNDVSLIDKDLFVSMLGFDSSVWNLDNIDIENGIYPTIRN